MKYSVFTVMMPEYTVKQAIAKLAKLGYDGIELRFRDNDDHKCSVPVTGASSVAGGIVNACKKKGLEIPILSSYLGIMDDPRELTAAIEGAAAFGAKAVRISSGWYQGHLGGASFSELFERSRKVFRSLMPIAKANGIRILSEIHTSTIMPSCSAARRLAEGLPPEQFGVIHDAGNMAIEGFERWKMGLEILGEYLGHVHVKNSMTGIAEKQSPLHKATKTRVFGYSNAPMNAGCVDWTEMVKALKDVGYDGWLSFEDFYSGKKTDVKIAEDIVYLKSIETELATTPSMKKWRAKKNKPIRLGLIGCGGMGQSHLRGISQTLPELYRITAACDVVKKNATKTAKLYGASSYTDYNNLLSSGNVDAVLVATPHFFHPDAAIAALNKNVHVMCEKPVAVRASNAARMNAAARKSKAQFGVMYNIRTAPGSRKVKELLSSGEMGELRRVIFINNAWYRNQKYYDSGAWRGTWSGEGGGILMNQCPHDLDLFYWWFGKPKSVRAKALLGARHRIEVEDEVSAWLTMPGGAEALFFATTSDLAGGRRIEIYCEKGNILIEGSKLSVKMFNAKSATDWTYNSNVAWPRDPMVKDVDVLMPETESLGSHQLVMKNFAMAIRGLEKLEIKGVDGIASVELANAMIMAGLEDREVTFPLRHKDFDKLLDKLQAGEFNK